MNFQNNNNFQIGFILVMLSVGVKLADDTFDLGIFLAIVYGLMALIGIKKEFRKKNIGSYLNYLILVEMKKKGYKGVDVGWFDEKNIAAHATIAITGAEPYKKFCVFNKDLNNSKKV